MNKKPYTYFTSPFILNLPNAKILQLREQLLTSTACECYQEFEYSMHEKYVQIRTGNPITEAWVQTESNN